MASESTRAAPPAASAGAPVLNPHKLTSSCLHPPTLLELYPPTLGSGFNGPTPAQLAVAGSDSSLPASVTMQYSVHAVPASMKQELRAIFPDLTPFAAAAAQAASVAAADSSAAATASPSSGTGAGSPPPPPAVSGKQAFALLPLLAIPTFQRTLLPLVSLSAEVEREKNRLLESFYAFARGVASKLRAQGCWADLVDPCSGYPLLGTHGSSIYSEVDSAAILLTYRMQQVGSCSMIEHPTWMLQHYPATALTTASLQQTLDAINETAKEMSQPPKPAAGEGLVQPPH